MHVGRIYLVNLSLLSLALLGFDLTHKEWTEVLSKYQDQKSMIRYRQLKGDVAAAKDHAFNRYVNAIQAVPQVDFDQWKADDQKAFLTNSYNALTIKLIIENYPVTSIKKIGGFFKKPWDVEFFSLLGGSLKTLDPIEHQWLRPKFKDFRIHAAANCASISCPVLRNEAYEGSKLEAQLSEQFKLWLADPSRNRYDSKKNRVYLSKIFDWYAKDFDAYGGIKAILRDFGPDAAKESVRKNFEIEYLEYDWNLNEAQAQ